jgi:hypothetical protein
MGKNSQDGNDVIAIDAGKARVQAVDRHASQAVVLDATNRGRLNPQDWKTWTALLFPQAPESAPASCCIKKMA